MDGKWWIVVGAALAMCGVALGAFGAHGLKTMLGGSGLDAARQAELLDDWDVGARYQMVHALAILVVGILARLQPNRWLHAAAGLFCIGILTFSGGLYAYVLTGTTFWALIVPLGGVAFLTGWLSVAVGAARWRNRPHPMAN